MKSKDQILLEQAYKLVLESHTPFTGSEEDLVYVDDLSGNVEKIRQAVHNGRRIVLKHLAHKDDLQEMGANVSDSTYYVFDRPTDFTQPAFILI